MVFKPQRIRDPLHNLVEFRAEEFDHVMCEVMQTRPFQRLRRVKQLGFSELVYPGATHSRLAHSLGAFHTARLLMQVVERHLGPSRYEPSKARIALAAALVHDVGHGPFSHAFEDFGKRRNLRMADHASVGEALIREGDLAAALNRLGSGFANDVATILTNERPTIYGAVVSSQFDADRLDYMRRDRLMSGVGVGGIDFEWLLANLEVGEIPFGVGEAKAEKVATYVIGPKAIRAAESYVHGLFQLYPSVYYHKTTRAAEKLLTEMLCRVLDLVKDESVPRTGLSESHPLVRFAKNQDSVESVIPLDDTVIWGALSQMSEADDPLLKEFSVRLRDRKLYKSIDVREHFSHRFGLEAFDEIDKACAETKLKVNEWSGNVGGGIPRLLTDEAERSPYRQIQEAKGPANQIWVKTAAGEIGEYVDIEDRSEVLRGLRNFRLFRLYFRAEDSEAKEFAEKTVQGKV